MGLSIEALLDKIDNEKIIDLSNQMKKITEARKTLLEKAIKDFDFK